VDGTTASTVGARSVITRMTSSPWAASDQAGAFVAISLPIMKVAAHNTGPKGLTLGALLSRIQGARNCDGLCPSRPTSDRHCTSPTPLHFRAT
jgi:hypothetical protein